MQSNRNVGLLAACLVMATCYLLLVFLRDFTGLHAILYVVLFILAGTAYLWIVWNLPNIRISIVIIWGIAILFRILMLTTTPSLSDDVYRFVWEGHLWSNGISAYAYPVFSPNLNPYSIPLRNLVNHPWLASPYLPAAQILFFLVDKLASGSVVAFQVGSVLLDLMSGGIIIRLLKKVGLPANKSVVYLWNPLIVIEFAHGAHIVDALMVFLSLMAFDLILLIKPNFIRSFAMSASVFLLALATLTKGLPGLFVFSFSLKWGWKRLLSYAFIVTGLCFLFAIGPGWGLASPGVGTGLFGSLRVYLQQWHNNGGIMDWIELVFTGYQPIEAIQSRSLVSSVIRLFSVLMIGLAAMSSTWLARSTIDESWHVSGENLEGIKFLRIAVLPFWVYILVAQTVYPWYLALILGFLPFFYSLNAQDQIAWRFIPAWLYLSITTNLTYLSHFKSPSPGEYILVQAIEYIPFYFLLGWASLPFREKLHLSFARKGK